MVFTDVGRKYVALRLGSSLPDLYIQYVGIGVGSATVSASDDTLITESQRITITGSPDFTANFKVGFQADFNSVQMSGTDLTEFGLFDVGSATGWVGSVWQREGFSAVEFDGTNELQIVSTLQVLESGTS